MFVAAKLRHAEQVAQEVLDSTDGADFIDHRAQIAWASDHNALRTVVVEKQSDVSNTQLGLNTADVKELHVTVHDAVSLQHFQHQYPMYANYLFASWNRLCDSVLQRLFCRKLSHRPFWPVTDCRVEMLSLASTGNCPSPLNSFLKQCVIYVA